MDKKLRRKRKYSSEDGLHGLKHVVSQWKEIIKNFVVIYDHCNKVLVTNTTECNPQK
jgi:hypothetical protein